VLKLALALRMAAVLRCVGKQRRAATGLLLRWLNTRRYSFRPARDASRCLLYEAGFGTAYGGSAPLHC